MFNGPCNANRAVSFLFHAALSFHTEPLQFGSVSAATTSGTTTATATAATTTTTGFTAQLKIRGDGGGGIQCQRKQVLLKQPRFPIVPVAVKEMYTRGR